MRMRAFASAAVLGLGATVLGTSLFAGSLGPVFEEVAATMIEVEGEGAKYWTRWRGPSGQGIVKAGKYRDKWSPTEGVKWKVPVPGLGHSSPIIWGNRIFLTTAHDNGARLSMLAFDRTS